MAELYIRKATGLVRELGLLESLSIICAGAIGSGIQIFVLLGPSVAPGASMPLCYLVVGALIFIPAVVIAYITADLPRSSAMYVFVSRMTHPAIGFVTMWGVILACGFSIGALSLMISETAGSFFALFPATAGFGRWMLTSTGRLIMGLTLLIICWLMMTLGARIFGKFMDILFLIPLTGFLISMAIFAMTPPSAVPTLYDKTWGAGAYAEIESIATKYGYSPEKYEFFSFPATMSTVGMALWAYAGYERASYVAGEVKAPKKTMLYGIVGGTLLLIILYTLMAYLSWSTYGHWITKYCIALKHTDEFVINPPAKRPFIPYFAASLVPGATALHIWLFFCGILWLYNSMPTRMLIISRATFSLSFDRFLPEALGYVSPKTHSPVWADLLGLILGIVGLLYSYVGLIPGVVSVAFFEAFLYLALAFGAMMYPFIKEDAYKAGLRWEVAGFPAVSILGAIMMAIEFILFNLCVLKLKVYSIIFMAIWLGLGALVYLYYVNKNRKRGIEPTAIFGEVPPT